MYIPFNFESHGIEAIAITVDDQTERFLIDESTEQFIQFYNVVSVDLKKSYQGVKKDLKYLEFLNGYAFFPFDLFPS